MSAASSVKLSDKPSWVNRRELSVAQATAIVAELKHRHAEKSGGIFRSGGSRR
jgi:hypothetical protein